MSITRTNGGKIIYSDLENFTVNELKKIAKRFLIDIPK